METKKISINGEQLSYYDNQKGNIALLFIHGAFINKTYWEIQLSHFSENYRTLAIDLPGHGKSSFNQKVLNGQRFGKDVSEFIHRLSLKNVIIIGHSFGSDVMLETVAQNANEIIGIIEIDHMKNIGIELPKEVVNQLINGLNTNFEYTCEQFAKQALLTEETNHEIVSKLLKDYRNINPEIGIPLLEYGFSYHNRQLKLLKELKIKLHSIHVNYSPTNEENLNKHLGDNYELYKINGTCHYPMLENPSRLNATIEKILSVIIGV
ncbi:alpha/beta fold hydrolase [Maribacter sp. 2308TA10-17]|uniref:alpha/beta fold hydrolase n=1 Tax=Maribacter sp. 2308TA10-17 TaxID=3386276 RepID=UPI0039BD1BE5